MMLLRPSLAAVLMGLMLSFSFCPTSAQAQTNPTAPTTQTGLPAAQKDNDPPVDLSTDTHLQRPVTVHEIGIAMNTLLHKVSTADVTLTADRNCDNLEVHLNLRNRPLRQLMGALAQLVPGTWYHAPDGKGYVLRMSRAAVNRRQRWWNLFLGERKRLWDMLPERALQTMRARPEIKGEVTSADGNVEGLKQHLLAGPSFFNLLPAPLQEAVAHSLDQTPYYEERGPIWESGMDEGAYIVPFTDLPAEAQKRLTTQFSLLGSPTDILENGYVRFENVGDVIAAEAINANGDVLRTGYSINVNSDDLKPALRLDHQDLPRKVKQLGRDAPSVWKELAAYQQSRVWSNQLPDKIHLSYQNRAAILEWLAEQAHLEFVADYYSLIGGRRNTLPSELKEPLETALNKYAAELDLSWKQLNDIYLFRNNRWYRDDELEVPAALLQRWLSENVLSWTKDTTNFYALSKQAQAARVRRMLDWEAEVVSALTPWQIFNGLGYATVPPEKREQYAWGPDKIHVPADAAGGHLAYAPFRWEEEALVVRYSLMLFYASLSAEQRTALLAGNLDFTALTGDQKRQAIYLQPLLQTIPPQNALPILLGLRQRIPSLSIPNELDLHLVIAHPSLQPLQFDR